MTIEMTLQISYCSPFSLVGLLFRHTMLGGIILIFTSAPCLAQNTDRDSIGLYNKAVVAHRMKDDAQAIDLLEQATKLAPGFSDAYFNLGILYERKGLFYEAKRCFEECLQLKPDDSDARIRLGNLLAKIGKNSEAQKQLTLVAPQTPMLATRIETEGNSSVDGLVYHSNKSIVDRTGNRYIANFVCNSIDMVSKDGIKSVFSNITALNGPIDLAFDHLERLYVANYAAGTICRITNLGSSSDLIAKVLHPVGLAFADDDHLLVLREGDSAAILVEVTK